ncbi:MAG: peptidoglycan DD-metalloendopeptidase family protein [Eudoraea sp.]|nr:peptidoglycan DD-metalloendopeptidase family protein [Eudoraea sp.]
MKVETPVSTLRSAKPISILDPGIPLSAYFPIDLSVSNKSLSTINITDPEGCEGYINQFLQEKGGQVAYGGYLEVRNLYTDKPTFYDGKNQRNIHLGVDFWAKAGTSVITPMDGVVHSFENNSNTGDYGPAIILEHQTLAGTWYTLYGHLSLESLENLETGRLFKAGSTLGTLGTPDINVNYAPHLHFQLIRDIGPYLGDYPGVCSSNELEFYRTNCPNPCILLGL